MREASSGAEVDHDARPSISVNIRRALEEFLKENAKTLPDSLSKLNSDCGIKLVLTSKDDKDNLGCFIQYRVAFYVAGASGKRCAHAQRNDKQYVMLALLR